LADGDSRSAALLPGVLGLVFVLVGAAALAALVIVSNSRAPAAEHAMISLGLAGSVLVSAIAQGLVIVGLWLLWRSARRGRAGRRRGASGRSV
jgi:hypothetical protein